MEYYKYIDTEVNIGRIMYGEFDEEYYCIRAVFEENKKIFTTNFIYDNDYILPEGSFIKEQEYLGEKITEEDFNKKWENGLKPFLEKWNEIKNKYNIGDKIIVKIICIYPQGIIFDIGETFHGIGNHDECEMKYNSKYLYKENKMEMDIIGYDENNMWIELKP